MTVASRLYKLERDLESACERIDVLVRAVANNELSRLDCRDKPSAIARRRTWPWELDDRRVWRHFEQDYCFQIPVDNAFIQCPSDTFIEVVDVASNCSSDCMVQLTDMGTARIVGDLQGPWLNHALGDTAVPLAKLLELVVDIASEKRTEDLVTVLREAMRSQRGSLLESIVITPASALGIRLALSDSAVGRVATTEPARGYTVWVRTIKHVMLL